MIAMALTGNREFRDDIVRVSTLTVAGPPLIDGYTFSNCTIVGPAVLLLLSLRRHQQLRL